MTASVPRRISWVTVSPDMSVRGLPVCGSTPRSRVMRTDGRVLPTFQYASAIRPPVVDLLRDERHPVADLHEVRGAVPGSLDACRAGRLGDGHGGPSRLREA